jgi:hypothetical protein
MPSAAAFCFCPLRELFHEDSVLRRQGVRAQRERSTNFVRYCQHPLPERHVRQNVIDQVRSGPAHPPRRTARAGSSAFARERHHDFLAALRAQDAEETSGPNAAIEGAAKLVLDVARQASPTLLLYRREERLEVLAHDDVQHGGLRLVARIGPRRRRNGARSGRRRHRRARVR